MPGGKLFREPPPKEFVNEILCKLKFQGLDDSRWFTRDQLSLDTLIEWLPLLEPYYIPCKARRFLSDIDTGRMITILRHILHPLDYDLRTQERMYKLQKTTMYQIYSLNEIPRDLSANELKVEFL
jgi:hypothetical protein